MQDENRQVYDLDSADFFAAEVLADPYALMAQMRAERPVMKFHQSDFGRDQYVVTTHELVDQVYRDNKTFSSKTVEIFTGGASTNAEAEAIYATSWPEVHTLLTSDEPDHTRLRALSQKAFMPSRIKRMSDLIALSIDDLIDKFIERGECDFVREFAIPLPINTVSDILGLPTHVHDKLYDWTFSLMRRNGQMATPDEQIHDAHQIVEMKQFVAAQIEDRRSEPKDDLISDLVTSEVDGESPLDDLEILSTVLLLIVGGAETTRSSLIATMARLMTNPDQYELLRNDLSLTPQAIEEVLRLDTPGTALWRIATRDVELAGVKIPAGGVLMVRMDSANRDKAQFAEPDRFNIMRPEVNRHLAFGKGIHFCIGFRLARAQINLSIPALLTRMQNLQMIEEKSDLRVHPSVHTKCFRELGLSFTPGPRLAASAD